jgi:hypothetical protein
MKLNVSLFFVNSFSYHKKFYVISHLLKMKLSLRVWLWSYLIELLLVEKAAYLKNC